MRTNVTELLRNFPKIRRAALAGERVVIQTREGNLILTAERRTGDGLYGALSSSIRSRGLEPDDSGMAAEDWTPSL